MTQINIELEIKRIMTFANKEKPNCSAEGRRIINYFEKELNKLLEKQ